MGKISFTDASGDTVYLSGRVSYVAREQAANITVGQLLGHLRDDRFVSRLIGAGGTMR